MDDILLLHSTKEYQGEGGKGELHAAFVSMVESLGGENSSVKFSSK